LEYEKQAEFDPVINWSSQEAVVVFLSLQIFRTFIRNRLIYFDRVFLFSMNTGNLPSIDIIVVRAFTDRKPGHQT